MGVALGKPAQRGCPLEWPCAWWLSVPSGRKPLTGVVSASAFQGSLPPLSPVYCCKSHLHSCLLLFLLEPLGLPARLPHGL